VEVQQRAQQVMVEVQQRSGKSRRNLPASVRCICQQS
jgi:hypothetical protein